MKTLNMYAVKQPIRFAEPDILGFFFTVAAISTRLSLIVLTW